ncbi:Por secretion system C-terminal sorting domain-containing protein [Filimonas lacunae]|uniref:Por secretion system C-terminal sorting domain-containing protein n=2 Tax=Filimonas lacunae TaxID=477680 RepID=A0A173MHM9_9BACT|nr:hypothetical protein FLA_3016 [Filimonas lacunae]SIS96695.1 Por secretion system C-terminal sorting domain-containing protein [Filimonas lacunae]
MITSAVLALTTAGTAHTQAFIHPGLLHTEADFTRMRTKVNAAAQPWKGSWDILVANGRSQLTYTPNPVDTVRRGGTGENYSRLFNDIAAAYQTALRWKITGDAAYADKSIAIMNAWSNTLQYVTGNADRFLASGIYGYQFANAAEIMRTYSGWAATDFTRFQNMLLTKFYPLCDDFLLNHNTACITNYWANWDLCNMAAILAIGVLCDRRDLYSRAIDYFKTGAGNGSITHAVWYLHSSTLGQWQESGRDQGHSTLGIGLLASFCEMAWNQGDDMYGYDSNRFMKGAEYVAQYNTGNTVPYTTYTWGNGQNCAQMSQTIISDASRGNLRPVWEMVYNHYANRMGLSVPGIAAYATLHRPEGGGGNYGTTSGGFDQLGFGSLTFTRDPLPTTGPVNGIYKIFARHSGQAMDVMNNGTANGTNVRQWPANDCVCQQWTLTNAGSNQYTLVGVGSGKNLDIASNSTADGANAAIWQSTGGNNQKFTFTPVGGGFYRITPVHSGKCLDVDGASLTNGANIFQWTYQNGKNEHWQLVPVGGAAAVTAARIAVSKEIATDTTNTSKNEGYALYPNPAQNELTVLLPGKQAANNTLAVLQNVSGQIIQQVKISGSKYLFHLQGMPKGVYWLRIQEGERTVSLPFVKE